MQKSRFQFWPPWKLLTLLERRFRKARPGSVLILVVALLVLLALLGTAFINTARTDRASAAQNSFNTEVELLLQGLVDMTKASAVNGLFGPSSTNSFHQTATTQPSAHYAASDYPTNTESSFIGDRYPTLLNLTTTASTSNLPLWQFVSSLNNPVHFDSPYINLTGTPPTPSSSGYPIRSQLSPTSVSWTNTSGQTLTYPALGYFDTTKTGSPYTVALAADADGDGIADSALFRLPVGEINGVTYYGGVRVIDNAAAVNAAIAWQAVDPTTVTSGIPGNFYPTNIDLNGLLVTGDTLTNLNTWRFDNQASPSLTPVDDRETPPTGGPPPVADTPMSRSDFYFGNTYEAFWMQLGRRIANPGYIAAATGGQYQALSLDEAQVLAHDFILRSPWVTSPSQSTSEIEQNLSYSTFGNPPTSAATLYRSAPYAANQAVNWYDTNFDFVTGNMPLRSMLVTQNGVSNFIYSKIYSEGTYNPATTYHFGEWVTFTEPAANSTTAVRAYVCLQQSTGVSPDPTNPDGPNWEREPWASAPTKVSANTATFGQLWLGYFSAMAQVNTTNPLPTAPACQSNIVPTAGNPQNAMFRSSLRTAAAPMTNAEMVQLRSALAAINTQDLRDTDDDVTSRQIAISDATGATAYSVMVYGLEKQPYITEVYASNHGGSFLAIELYNPYPTAISMAGWQLVPFTRAAGAPLTPGTSYPATAWNPVSPSIGAGQYVVLTSAATPPSGMTFPPQATLIIVNGLDQALGNDLVILKPRLANGTLSTSAVATNTYNESTVTDLVPVDSYDLTGLPTTEPFHWHTWHYIRPNDVTQGKAWHWVYPGPYNSGAGGSSSSPRQGGTSVTSDPQPDVPLSTMGIADATTASPYTDRPLQIANQDFGGPKSVANYPYGAFARNADLLQVTYIGAYRVEDTSSHIIEMNPVTMDSATANDPNLDNDTTSEQYGRQNIGRFTPVHWQDSVTASTTAGAPPTPTYTTEFAAYTATHPAAPNPQIYFPDDYWTTDNSMQTAYHWAFDLFDYVTVQAPHDDYLPDVDPLKYPPGTSGGPGATPVANSNYLVANAGYSVSNPPPTPPVLGAVSNNYPASATEETVPVHGRININTANWRVLATLPMFDGAVYGTTPNNFAAANTQLAQSIVYYRDVDDGSTGGSAPLHPHGAFQSIDELNNVPITAGSSTTPPIPTNMGYTFRNVFGKYLASQAAGTTMAQTPPSPFVVPAQHGSNTDGDLSPFNASALTTAGGDLVYGDFENQNLALNRISNLITTRSDSFTAYVIVQGWRNAGTATPTLVVQRRAAFILDRSVVTPSSKTAATTNIPSY
jgi:hypothetical protein